nr:hypothetical protein [Ramlibacter sp.]
MTYYDQVQIASEAVALAHTADVVIFNGDIDEAREDILITRCNNEAKSENIVLLLCTSGGLPDSAYRMARYFQSHYKKFTVIVCGKCKSAGTLLTIGAHEVVMGDRAELGPLDIQLGKKDAFFEDGSGLTVVNALEEIESKAYQIFENTFVKLILRTKRRVTLKTATALATEFAVGLMSPVVSQIDPMHVGEVARAMRVGREYGERLSAKTNNLQPEALHKLVNGYPSHGFVIDQLEAESIFNNVRQPIEVEKQLISLLGANSRIPKSGEDPLIIIFSKPQEVQHVHHHPQDTGEVHGEPEAAGVEAGTGGSGEGSA